MTILFESRKFARILLGGILLIYIISLIGRPQHVDDAWMGEHAYWFAKSGYVKSELMRGITNHEEKLVVYHKMHAVLGAAVIQIFGFSLYALKSINLLFLLLFLSIYYRYFKLNNYRNGLFFAALVLLFFHKAFFEYTFVFRPDIPAMAMGFLSYMLLYKSLKQKDKWIFVALAGLSAAIAALFHLNGLIYIFAGFVVLLMLKRYRWGLIFGTAAIVILAFYFLDMTSPGDIALWIDQYSNSSHFGKKFDGPFVLGILNRIGQEHMRYFHSPKEIAFTALLIVSLMFAAGRLKQHRILLIYTLLLALALSVISIHKTSYYLILLLPWFILLISLAGDLIINNRKPAHFFGVTLKPDIQLKIISSLIVIYLAVQLVYIFPVAFDKTDNAERLEIIYENTGPQTDSLNIVAPMFYIFEGIERFNRIQSEICYNELLKADTTVYGKGFLKKTTEFDIDYVILADYYITHFGIDTISEKACNNTYFDLLYRSNDLVILKNQSR